jgi:hypothetical protein
MNVCNDNAATCGRNHKQGYKQGTSNHNLFLDNEMESHSISPQYAIASNDSNAETNNIYFPQRLFRMLEEIRLCRENLADVVSWHVSGMAFVIHNLDVFVDVVLPVYFRSQTKITSFQRQLNNYGFQRVQDRKHIGNLMYCHKDFCQDYPHLVQKICLKKCKNQHPVTATARDCGGVKPISLLRKTTPNKTLSSDLKPPTPLERIYANTADQPHLEQLGDDILDEAVAELLCEPEESRRRRSSGDYLDENFHLSEYGFSQQELTVQDWDPETESLEALEEL